MKKHRLGLGLLAWMFSILLLLGTGGFTGAQADHGKEGQGQWWQVLAEDEVPSSYYDSILYSEIAPHLHQIRQNSKRVRVKVIGQSAGGRNLFLATVAAPGDDGRFGHYKNLRRLMIRNPERALQLIDRYDDFKVPVFINGSIHGDEYPGTDAAIRLIETLAYENSQEVQAILDNIILLVNVVQNPDGRVLGTRSNAVNFDLNRDMITQSQPETRATVKIIADWNPMVFLDLHGFVAPMLIEPCTPPHNPNYEYDLYLGWALDQAWAMAEELFAQTGETDVIIPYLTWPDGWDDFAPIYAAMYPMLHGAYGHTLETPHEDERGVDAHYAAVWGALKFVVANKKEMIRDQIEVYRRGALDLPQVLIPDDLLAETPWDQYNDLTIKEFPKSYIIPVQKPLQENPYQAAELIDFLIYNGVQVEKTRSAFTVSNILYPKGTYVVRMDQPKRSLANTILEDGIDVSDIEGLTFYSPPAAWSHPLLWGVSRTIVTTDLEINTQSVKQAVKQSGSMEQGPATAFAFVPKTLAAFQAINLAIAKGYTLYRSAQTFSDGGRSFEAGTIVLNAGRQAAKKLQKEFALDLFGLETLPENLVILETQRIAAYGDEGLSHCLTQLGFDFDEISAAQLNAGIDLSEYDLIIHGDKWWSWDLDATGAATILQFCTSGGDYIGIGQGGASFAAQHGIIDVTMATADGNGIVSIDFDTNDPVTAGFSAAGHAFVYDPVWFSTVGDGIDVSIWLNDSRMLVSGYWPAWQTSPALGMPIMVSEDAGPKDTVLMGIDATFRGHPKNTFKLVGNAILSGLDNLMQ